MTLFEIITTAAAIGVSIGIVIFCTGVALMGAAWLASKVFR